MRTTISVFALISIFWIFGIKHPEVQATRNYGFEFSAFFLSGAALAFYGDFLKSRPWRLLSAVLILSTISWLLQYRYLAIALTLPLGIICFGLASSPFVRKAGLLGDVSYGMYLYAFPIQQLVVMLWLPTVGFSATLIISLAITWALSLVSWHFVEKHALRLKPTIKQSGLVGPKSQSITPVSGRDVI
jgi:peptidoglycan/LPS O-acetylase OafA/YrhL